MAFRGRIVADANGRPSPVDPGVGITEVIATPPLILSLSGTKIIGSIDPSGVITGVSVQKSGLLVGNRKHLNLIEGADTSLTVVDNPGSNRIDVTIASSASITDGDKGDITVSGSGATWTIDDDAVTYAKLQNVSASSRILGRASAGAGDVEELTGAQVLALAGGAAVSHAHAATDITSGTLPVVRGGTGVSTWPNVAGGGDQGNIVFTTGHSTPLTASQKLYAIPEVGSSAEDVGLFINHRRYFAGNQPPSAPLHIVTGIGASASPEERVVAMLGANANLSIYGQRRTVSVMLGHAPDGGTDQGKLRPESSGKISYSWDHPVWTAGPIPASPYTQEFFISVPTALGSPTKILGCKGDGTTNAYHGMNVYDGQLVVEAKKGLIDTGDCAVQVTSQVIAGAGERAAVYLQGLGTGGYAAFKMGCNAKSSEFLVSVGNTIDGFEIRDTNAAATRVSVSNTNGFVGVHTSAPQATLDVRGGILASASVPSVPTVSPIEIHAKQTSLAIGETAGIRIDCGADPHYQSPGAVNTNIGVQAFVNNGTIRDANLWGINCVVIQSAGSSPDPTTSKATLGGGTQYGIHVVAAELEVCNAATAGTVASDWFEDYNSTKKIRTNGLELTLHTATAMNGNAALTTFAGSFTNASKWWQAGIGLSCVKDVGIDFRKIDPSYPDPFQTTMLDGSTLGLAIQPFMRCRSGGNTRLDFFNDADHSVYLNIDTGSTVACESALLFSDRGNRKWLIGKDSGNRLQIGWNDGATPVAVFSAYIDSEVTPTTALLSFYGAAPTAKPTVAGSKGGNAALASLLTALATLGLITDSTT